VIILTPRPLYHGKEHPVPMKLGATWSLESVRVLGKRNTFAGSGNQIKAVNFITISHTRYACSLLHSVLKYALLLTTINKRRGGLRCQEKIRKWRHFMKGNWRKLHIHKVKPLALSDPYMGRTAQLTSRRCILNTYSTNIRTEYFKRAT
jgi:hypothetical protein